jgi:hypothetical protein
LCNNGQLEPVGCFAPNRHRLTLGEVYTSGTCPVCTYRAPRTHL